MRICELAIFLGVCAMASAQLDGGSILGGGGGNTGMGRGGLGGGMGMGGGGGLGMSGPGGMGGAGRGGARGMGNPLNAMMMGQMMADPSGMSLPVMSMMMRDPSMMQNPMGAVMVSSALGMDVNKIAAPMAMMGGGGNLMRWLPLMMGDPSTMGLLYSMGMGGMGMGGMMGPMAPLGMMAAFNA